MSFFLIAFTDLIDGYLARRMRAESNFGRCFDPIADKILVVSILFALTSIKKADIIPAMLITCREIFISGVREFALQRGAIIKVSKIGKWKTALQFIAITVILASARHSLLCDVGNLILWLATVLAVISAYEYTGKCRLLSK
jgi:cardiolipin synthase (CMP-forming)